MERFIFHIDMNCYFASVTTILHPEYKGKPIIIGHDTPRGIVSTCNYEARSFGVHSAMPMYQAKQLCKKAIIVNEDFAAYEKFTYLFIEIIKKYSKLIELASIDECYVDVSDVVDSYEAAENLAKQIQYDILNDLGLPCSIGISNNKYISKMASDIKKPLGITVIKPSNIKEKIWKLDIGCAFGIGKKSAEKLREMGILTIKDFIISQNNPDLNNILGKNTNTFVQLLSGFDNSPVNINKNDLKSVGHSRTFDKNINDRDTIVRKIKELTKMVSDRAKDQYLVGKGIQVVIKYTDFKTKVHQNKLDDYTNDFDTMYRIVLKSFDELYDGSFIRLVGVTLQNTVKINELEKQLSIYDVENPDAFDKINETRSLINELNSKIGKNIFKTAREIK